MVVDNDKEKVEGTDVSQEDDDYIAWKDALSFCQQYNLPYSDKVKLIQGILDTPDLPPYAVKTLYTIAISAFGNKKLSSYLPPDHTVDVKMNIDIYGILEMYYIIKDSDENDISKGTVNIHDFLLNNNLYMKNLERKIHGIVSYCSEYHKWNESLKIK